MRRILLITLLTVTVLAMAGSVWAQGNPCNPCGGKEAMKASAVPVNPCDAKFGTVYYISDPMSRNTVTFSSEAPLEDIVGTTNQISGYFAFDPNNLEKGAKGRITVSVSSLTTGIPLRDEHLLGDMWLDALTYPTITFEIAKVKNVKVIKKTDSFTTYELQVSGPFKLHGKTRTIDAIARITVLPESEQTKQKMPGDLVAVRTSFKVSLADFGIKGFDGVVGSKVSESIEVAISLVASNVDPSVTADVEAASNPCNPCGGKNPCNPCGGKNPCNPCGK